VEACTKRAINLGNSFTSKHHSLPPTPTPQLWRAVRDRLLALVAHAQIPSSAAALALVRRRQIAGQPLAIQGLPLQGALYPLDLLCAIDRLPQFRPSAQEADEMVDEVTHWTLDHGAPEADGAMIEAPVGGVVQKHHAVQRYACACNCPHGMLTV
jgi:hypothetical protein